jgi:hypothetical protein
VRQRPGGLVDLLGAQIDSLVVPSLPEDVEFDLAIRIVGTERDFQRPHLLQVVLSDPDLVEVGAFDVQIEPREPAPSHIAGYEINYHVPARINFEADQYGGFDLSFALDGEAAHALKTTMSVVEPI